MHRVGGNLVAAGSVELRSGRSAYPPGHIGHGAIQAGQPKEFSVVRTITVSA